MGRVFIVGFGVLAYGMFGVSLVWLLGFLLNIGVPVSIDDGLLLPAWQALIWDLLLLSVFGLQHSVMARPGFKRWWIRMIPASIERSMYVLISSLIVIAICVLWLPLPTVLWRAEAPLVMLLAWSGFGLGIIWLFAASFHIDHFELLGLKQVWRAARRRNMPRVEFAVRGLYRLMRHPIYVGWLLIFWCTPVMTYGHLLFAVGMTVYTLIAIRYEERDLVADIGPDYQQYADNVPALVPTRHSFRSALLGGSIKGRLAFAVFLVTGVVVASMNAEPLFRFSEMATLAVETRALENVSIESDGRRRDARLVLPTNGRPEYLVVFLHGAGGSPERLRLLSDRQLDRFANIAGWAVVYPQGVGGTWNDCRTVPDYPAKRQSVDDVGYLSALIMRLTERFDISPERILLAGFSNGGHMAIRYALEQPEMIHGVALIGAQLPHPSDSVCGLPTRPVKSLIIAGTDDPVSPYQGGHAHGLSGAALGRVLSVEDTARYFAGTVSSINELAYRRTLSDKDADAELSVEVLDCCHGTGQVRLYRVAGGGHAIPARTDWFPPEVGRVTGDMNISHEFQDFLMGDEG